MYGNNTSTNGLQMRETHFTGEMTIVGQEMPRLMKELNLFLRSNQISSKTRYAVNLAIEEILTSSIGSEAEPNPSEQVQLEVDIDEEDVTVHMNVAGRAFNPLSIPHPDMRKPIGEWPEKWLGIHLVRNLMHSMWYQRLDGKNIIEIRIAR